MSKASTWFFNWVKSPTGPKTTHFWAPLINGFFPIQGLYDWNRNPENISLEMQAVLVCMVVFYLGYSSLFMRWSVRIKPISHILFCVHFSNFSLQGRLMVRRFMWEREFPEKASAQKEKIRLERQQAIERDNLKKA